MEIGNPILIVLHPSDNVGVVVGEVSRGYALRNGARVVIVLDDIPFGHKCALTTIANGSPVIKCGVPIGLASQDIQTGAHVHLHNLRSSYLPTYTTKDDVE